MGFLKRIVIKGSEGFVSISSTTANSFVFMLGIVTISPFSMPIPRGRFTIKFPRLCLPRLRRYFEGLWKLELYVQGMKTKLP